MLPKDSIAESLAGSLRARLCRLRSGGGASPTDVDRWMRVGREEVSWVRWVGLAHRFCRNQYRSMGGHYGPPWGVVPLGCPHVPSKLSLKTLLLSASLLLVSTAAALATCPLHASVYQDVGGQGFELMWQEGIPQQASSKATLHIRLNDEPLYHLDLTQSSGYGTLFLITRCATKPG